SGLEFVRSLPEERPMVIFLTAYKEHAHIGFDMQVVDYLVKPVAPDRFERAIKKAYAQFERTMDTVPLTRLDHPDHFFVFSDYVQIKIVISEIQFIESMGDYVKIHLDGKKKPVITLERLKNMAQRLHDLGFKRIHRSYLVNIAKVEAKQKSQVKVGNIWIPVGERFSID
ncbi:MAG: LytTR family DNA-binding domain-containing protein, partial [Bacteroidetes bacterium]|nr:LytTR family DNA-binding domain-containing protein [Bacteroidota bacterium]